MFTIAFKWEIPTLQDNKEERIVWTKGLTNNIEGFRKENICRHFIRERHPLECFYGKPPMKPMKKTSVFSLKQWCRASISQNFEYEAIKQLREEGGLPRELFEFITERSSMTPPTNKNFLLCEQGTWGEYVYPSMAMREEEWFSVASNNKIVRDESGKNHAMMIGDLDTDMEDDEEDDEEDDDEWDDFWNNAENGDEDDDGEGEWHGPIDISEESDEFDDEWHDLLGLLGMANEL